MKTDHRTHLSQIQDFEELVEYLRSKMDWPVGIDNFVENTFEYEPEELGIDATNSAKIKEIKRLRPLHVNQPWGIFFVKFEPKYLPVVALRRILGRFVQKNTYTSGSEEGPKWATEDLLFVSNCGQGENRRITFAHFTPPREAQGLPKLKIIDWNDQDTGLHLDHVGNQLTKYLLWPSDENDVNAWCTQWRKAFTVSHGYVVSTSKELSDRLAELARRIRKRIQTALEIETENGPITQLLKNFQKTLAHDIDRDGFADMVAQTITYGMLSARITDSEKSASKDLTTHLRTHPLLSELMALFLSMDTNHGYVNYDELGVIEVEEFLKNTDIESVVRDFGDRNPREDPVIHFYEDFLAKYDQGKKVERGVFYTPRPVVSYIVKSIDALLRDQFYLKDGLADTSSWGDVLIRCNETMEIPDGVSAEADFVQILDPATGTGTFLVEVIGLIHQTMVKKWQDAGYSDDKISSSWNEYVPKHLLPRLFGYEILMAPYVIAHFNISLKLYETGYRFYSDERARVYLTNTLAPSRDSPQLTYASAIPALANEAQEVDKVKSAIRFTVILGNPPYSGESANKGDWIRELLRGGIGAGPRGAENYFRVNDGPLEERNPKWLNDDYVKFIRFSHWQIERTGAGVVGFITNHGYLDNPTFRGMRESLVATFSTQYILDLHGNTKKGEQSPDGRKDENVFDIQQGVAIGLFVKSGQENRNPNNRFDLWGKRELVDKTGKYDWLEENTIHTTDWGSLLPKPPLWLFAPRDERLWKEYEYGWRLTDIFPINSVGIVTARDKLTVQFTEEEMRCLVDNFVDLDTAEARKYYGLKKDTRDWKIKLAQEDIKNRNGRICPILYRPFDTRFTYYSGKSRGFICRPRPEIMRQMLWEGNLGLISCRQQSQLGIQWRNFSVTRSIVESCAISNKTKEINSLFPLYTYKETVEEGGIRGYDREPNISSEFELAFKKALELGSKKEDQYDLGILEPEDILAWIYAVFHSIGYRNRYEEQLRLDFPRVHLPKSKDLFQKLTSAGHDLIALHLLESECLDNPITTFFGSQNCKIGRVGWSNDTVWLDAEKVNAREGYRAVKEGTFGFHGVPEKVWDFHIGSYQVLHKWLNYRKERTLSDDDIKHYSKIVVALNETIPIMERIDEAIQADGGWPKAFVHSPT